ncbi:hypothetical protein B5M42_020530 [Paenibacillus athensensis]|uniref:hypothetical protein n=1 Tax=Paenibacillus athensensis TaxID=1967502 RepID=UPI001E514F0A|nr:hypothetical protein [Paenibacillus athensensis]MCD1261189.1 hypothetical protein [Paenibacillus athensensis]
MNKFKNFGINMHDPNKVTEQIGKIIGNVLGNATIKALTSVAGSTLSSLKKVVSDTKNVSKDIDVLACNCFTAGQVY